MSNENSNNSYVAIVRDLEFHWAYVTKPHNPFGTDIWDIQVRTEDESKVEELNKLGIKLKKHEDGYFFGNIKRKTVNAKGEPMSPPTVIDAAKQPLEADIGNGSKGNVKVFSYEYKVGKNQGRTAMLTAIQVTELIEYKGSSSAEDDFSVETSEATF